MHFTPALFKFLKDLKTNNNREWFQANKSRYENDVKEPMLRFIADFDSRLRKISPHFSADPRPVGGSLFRIYKDVRYSKDKSPYKTHVAAHFPHKEKGKDAHAPGFYLHLAPSDSAGGGGMWHPPAESLSKIRDRIASNSGEWKKVRAKSSELLGDALSRPPKGYDASHPFIDDIKRKDFFVMGSFTDKQVCSTEFMDHFVETCEAAAPLIHFLTDAMSLRWK